eukprot:3589385-Rhodomonas_salina.3
MHCEIKGNKPLCRYSVYPADWVLSLIWPREWGHACGKGRVGGVCVSTGHRVANAEQRKGVCYKSAGLAEGEDGKRVGERGGHVAGSSIRAFSTGQRVADSGQHARMKEQPTVCGTVCL